MNARRRLVPAVSRMLLAALLAGAMALVPSTGSAVPVAGHSDTLVFVPEADAYVDAAQPTVSFGTSNYLWVDAGSVKQSFVRFRLGGLTGRTVTDVRLRMYQTDASPVGGTVWSITSNDWDESVTWESRPAVDGGALGTFGAVEALTWYEVALDRSILSGDGPISFAIDSVDSDGARWASREHVSPPQLAVELEPVESDSFTFTPEADAYVDSSQPDVGFGEATSMWVDASPVKQAFLRFDVAGVAGHTVTGVRLRLRQTDVSPLGGRVFAMSSNDWGEDVTWNSRPAIDGGLLGTFGAVAGGRWYEADLVPTAVAGDGTISLAIDSTDADGARWRSRENVEVPQLIVDVARVDGLVRDGLTEVAAPFLGSSDPSLYAGNHRTAVTQSGRLLALHGRHGQGVQLAWRDPGGGWMMMSRGEAENGLLLGGTGTGDWVASIAVGRDSSGEEHAWVVWSGSTAQSSAPAELRRLSDLDSADGPTVGPATTVSSSGLGNSKVDVALETASDGSLRGCIAWLQRIGSSSWNVKVTWFTDPRRRPAGVPRRQEPVQRDLRRKERLPGAGRRRPAAGGAEPRGPAPGLRTRRSGAPGDLDRGGQGDRHRRELGSRGRRADHRRGARRRGERCGRPRDRGTAILGERRVGHRRPPADRVPRPIGGRGRDGSGAGDGPGRRRARGFSGLQALRRVGRDRPDRDRPGGRRQPRVAELAPSVGREAPADRSGAIGRPQSDGRPGPGSTTVGFPRTGS